MIYTVITIVVIIVCVLLSAVVLIQNPKGGGLSGSFGGVGQQLLGARHSTDIVEKLTWGFAIALLVLCLSTSFFVDKNAVTKKSAAPTETSEIEAIEKTKGNTFQTTPPAGTTTTTPPANQQTPPATAPVGNGQ